MTNRKLELEDRIDFLHDLSLWNDLKPEEVTELALIEREYSQIIIEEVRLVKQSKRREV